MGSQLAKINSKIIKLSNADDVTLSCDTIVSNNGIEDINLFLDNVNRTLNPANKLTKQIQNNLSLLLSSPEQVAINAQIEEIITKDIMQFIDAYSKQTKQDIQDVLQLQNQLQTALKEKIELDRNVNQSIFLEPYAASCVHKKKTKGLTAVTEEQQKFEFKCRQLSFFGLQTLTSMLLILIKSAEKNDPSVVDQILTLSSDLCEQIPIKCLSPSVLSRSTNNLLNKSLKPLANYVHELHVSENPNVAKYTIKILLSLSLAKSSLKDILFILTKLICSTDDVYDVRGILQQLNDGVMEAINEKEKAMHQKRSKRRNILSHSSDSDTEEEESEVENEDAEDEDEDDDDDEDEDDEDEEDEDDEDENRHLHEHEDENENEDESEDEDEDVDDDNNEGNYDNLPTEQEHLANSAMSETTG